MAKGNHLLGKVHGSIGDVTFYTMNGQQVSRARNRVVSNPNSDAQLVQRAIMSTVGRAYAAGKAIFDHSFEGRRVPSGSANAFRKVNANLLRAIVLPEIQAETPDTDCDGVVVARGSAYPVPGPYRVSQGSLTQGLYSIAADSGNADKLEATIAAPLTSEKLGEYCSRLGLVAGDIYTIVALGILYGHGWSAAAPENQYTNFPCAFGFIRLKVKSSALSSSTTMATATLDDMFEIDETGTPIPGTTLVTGPINIDQVVSGCVTGSLAVIRSQENSGLRSTSDMQCPASVDWGIKSAWLLSMWSREASDLQSPLILEGGNF